MSQITAVRIVNVDFYMAAPIQDLDVTYSDFRGSSVSQVPIIRIFGSTDNGKKICLHIHGVFPYLYIPYDGTEDSDTLKYQIAANIDKAINISFGQASSSAQHVYKISLVSGTPFYGYHAREHQFFKIYLFNPALERKVANMLQNEVILGKLYQPHEAHIPYILQFMIDFNLHGMSRILLTNIKFRNEYSGDIPKQSTCVLEADALCEHIVNRLEVADGKMGINPGIATLWEDERQRLRDKNEDSQIGPCLTLVNTQAQPTKSHLLFKKALLEKLVLSEDSNESADHNITVYPSETPRDKLQKLKNASFVDFHSPSSSQSGNESGVDLDATLVGEAKVLFDILQDLGDNNVEKEEPDSILSQEQKEEEDENDMDLSISMADTTPFKNIMTSLEEEDLFCDSLDRTLVPQLDGQHDDSSSGDEGSNRKRKAAKVNVDSKYGALPIYVSPAVGAENKGFQKSRWKEKFGDSLDNVKRQLNFKSSNLPDITVYEDSVECKYKPKTEKVLPIIKSSSEVTISDSKPKTALSVAQLYDLETNFEPKEGCSTKLTQNSDNYDLKLSSESSHGAPNEHFNLLLATQSSDDSFPLSQTKLSQINLPTGLTQTSNLSQNDESFIITPQRKPPSRSEIMESFHQKVSYEIPFYSDVADATGGVEIGHCLLKVKSKTTAHLEDFRTYFNGLDLYRKALMPPNVKWSHENVKNVKLSFCSSSTCLVEPVKQPPTTKEVRKWLELPRKDSRENEKHKEKHKIYVPTSPGQQDDSDMELSLTLSFCDSQQSDPIPSPILGKGSKKRKKPQRNSGRITGVTLNNTYGFKITPENYQDAKAVNEFQNITIIALELHFKTRGDLKPDPAYDPVRAIFYTIVEDNVQNTKISGVLAVGSCVKRSDAGCDVLCVESEEELFNELVALVLKWDPDILIGYETEMLSWGYLIERAQVLDNKLLVNLSRIKDKINKHLDERALLITGRIILDFWRFLRHEIALQSYTFENIVYHLLHKRVPLYSFKDLTSWWEDPSSLYRHRTISHYLFRVKALLDIMEQLDFIGRTSELARLFGIQFFEVLSRGSQFRVESMMLRLAKPLNYIPVSPSVQQRAKMKAPEFLPLILEPESKLYVDPVIVLDFQSLYPSMIIAYNYCFSTCIGKVTNLGRNTPFEFGATQLKISKARTQKLVREDCLNFSPCGVAFVKKHIRDGILPRMLREILDTRLMVKSSMKKNKEDKLLQKVLHNRQLGLKLIANVTYGYTAANFSGRMAAVEIADSVVSKGRETLQRAIAMVERTEEWGAKVVYGDTDSLFVLVAGKSKEEAFEIGRKIADAVTNDNPDPVKLKLEKVYLPCILQTKKRYVGYMYEGPDQEEPVYEAKGIETVRRDGCPAVAKMLEKCLRLLFETKDVSLVKKYVLRQFTKIITGRVSLQDLTFAREYRGASGYRPGACVPALELARKWTAVDKRNEPRRGERVPYVIVSGPPGVPLIRLVRSPWDFLNDPNLRPNAVYYITKVIIPPINRCFNLIGIDLMGWFNQMPRRQFQYLTNVSPGKKTTISQYFSSTSCTACGEQTQSTLCNRCLKDIQKTSVILHEKLRNWEQAYCNTHLICRSCTGIFDNFFCVSLDCPVLYRVNQTTKDLQQVACVRQTINSLIDNN